jgi:hypothetical protein
VTRVGVAISGGGHRAGLFGLGVLLYLVDAGRNRDLASISSVSGGSLTNGFVAQAVDVAEASPESFRTAVAPLARRLARGGTLFPPSAFTLAYLLLLALVALAGLVGVWFLPIAIGWRVAAFVLGLVLIGVVASWRGLVCSRAFARTLFSPDGTPTLLEEIQGSIDHVICATDLHAGEHVYFSKRFVCSYRYGWGTPGDLPLHVAVQCSAALPGAFPPRFLPTERHRFSSGGKDAEGTRTMVLVDGGVYDNMADQWMVGMRERRKRWPELTTELREPEEIVIVNGSGGLGWTPVRRLRIPFLGEILALLHDKTVLYDNGNSVRRQLAYERFLSGRLRGCIVDISQSPLRVADRYARGSGDAADRANEIRSELDREAWARVADLDARVGTTLWGFKGDVGARLLRHGYVLAMANLHVILGYPWLDVPDQQAFEELVT